MVPLNRIAAASLLASAAISFSPESHAADPTMVDCLSASEASIKLRKEHHFRESRQQLLVCAALTCPAEIRAECERRLVALNATIPTLIFEARDAAGNDLSAVSVTMDGKPLLDRLEGTAISLDPGAHTFHFETAGAPAVERSLVLREAEKDRRERIVFGSAPGARTSAPAAPAGGSTSASPPPAGGGTSTLRLLGIVSGSVGVVGLGVGAVFGVLAGSATSSQENACASPTNCPNHALALSEHATFTTDSAIEVTGFVAGGVLLAAGVGMFLAGGSKTNSPATNTGLLLLPEISSGRAGLTLRGEF